jgi:hypothetical protein
MTNGPIGALPTASADDCPDIEVVFARGTNEAPGLGLPGGAFVDSLRNKVGGRSVGTYAVNYPATYDFLAAANGANDASAHVQYMMGACPGTRLVLGGYSQGAAVMDVIAAVPFPAIGFNNPLQPVREARPAVDVEPGMGWPFHRPVQWQRPDLPDGWRKRCRAQGLRRWTHQSSGQLRRGPAVTKVDGHWI